MTEPQPTGSRRVPIPTLIGLGFGSLWAFLGCNAVARPLRSVLLLGTALVTAALLTILFRRATASASANQLFRRPAYLIAVAFEVAAILAASSLLPRFGLQHRLPQVVGILVGLHFLGLWRATGAPRFVWIAAGMTLLSALALLLPPVAGTLHPADALAGFGNALILWCGAALPMRSARIASRPA